VFHEFSDYSPFFSKKVSVMELNIKNGPEYKLSATAAYLKFFTSNLKNMRFQILIAASLKTTTFWDIAPCSLIEVVWWQYAPLKRRRSSTRLHCAMSVNAVMSNMKNFFVGYIYISSFWADLIFYV
jgi:hypothetical protein